MKNVIEIKDLLKEFKAKEKEVGLKGSFKALFRPKFNTITAVNKINFNVKKGELLALIGPNGAGKSTTLKMLTGILHPDSGSIKVLGIDPTKRRKQLAMQIGTVFGQKPQLWYHLPALDTFNLFAKIYEIDPKEYHQRLKKLVNLFEIDSFIKTPVRKLSLGQRMRCELVASLLHNPKVVFLDEPTIGLDITTKKRVRYLIKKLNKEENLTIILTSHDMQDIEKICNRVIIINHGDIVYEGSMKEIKRDHMKKKIVSVLFDEKVGRFSMKYVKVVKKNTFGMKLELDSSKRPIKDMIQELTDKFNILDITIADPPIEDVIENIYHQK